VIDASIALAWVHPAQATAETDALLQQLKTGVGLVVPALWFQEMANALLVLERRKRLKADERREALALLRTLNVESDLHGASLAFDKLTELAELHSLSVYDATYLELALRERLPLGTKDASLRAAARRCNATLLLH
jgi:predicted nucleic acid-binding protein